MKAHRFRFRAWDLEKKEMRPCSISERGIACVTEFSGWRDYVTSTTHKEPVFEGVNGHIMQSTGLCDKNGKEIFEGDILTGGYEMRWSGWTWWMYSNRTSRSPIESSNMAIIGNIYANPELKGKK